MARGFDKLAVLEDSVGPVRKLLASCGEGVGEVVFAHPGIRLDELLVMVYLILQGCSRVAREDEKFGPGRSSMPIGGGCGLGV